MIIIIVLVFLVLFLGVNEAYRRTNNYKNRYFRVSHLMNITDNDKFDVINLGSSQPFFGFDYSKIRHLHGYNFAVYPQYFEMDYAVLQQFANNVKKNGIVIICISLLNFFGGGKVNANVYYPILKKKLIPGYNILSWLSYRFPLFFKPHFIRYVFKDSCPKEYEIEAHPCFAEEQYEEDADGYIRRWNKGFGINIPSMEINVQNKLNFQKNIRVLQDMVSFCRANELKPVFVMLPTTEYLTSRFTDLFVDEYVIKLIRQAAKDIPFLNYFGKKQYMNQEWYMSSFFLNARGRCAMTETILNDISNL